MCPEKSTFECKYELIKGLRPEASVGATEAEKTLEKAKAKSEALKM